MNGILSRMKDGLWSILNAPNTELVDGPDEDWYDDEDEAPMVSRRREIRYDDADMHHEIQEPPRRKDRRAETARQAQNNKVLEMYNKGVSGPEVIIRHPLDVSEAAKICDFIREDKMCVVDLTGMERSMAQRIADFLGGACYALSGCIQRISKDIFIIVPEGVRISGDLKDELEKDGYIIPKASGRR